MEDIRRVVRHTPRPAPERALIVPARRAAGTQVVAGKAYLTTTSPTPAQVTQKIASLPQITIAPTPSFSVGWNPDVTLAPAAHTLHLPRGRRAIKRFSVGLVAAAVLFLSVYVSLDALHTTNQAKEQFAAPSPQVASATTTAPAPTVDEAKPPSNWLSSYAVAPDAPRIITIPSQNVKARVTKQGMAADGSLQAPKNIHDTGWYENSSKPGQGGAVLIDGHATGPTAAGVFDNINKLQPGDTITIERGDGVVLTYAVTKTETVPSGSVNMKSLLLPVTKGTKGLNLISCTGAYDAKTNTYADRVLVFATQI